MVREPQDLQLELKLKAWESVHSKEISMESMLENLLEHLMELLMEPNLLEHPWEFSMELRTVGVSAHPSELLSGILKVQGS